VNRVQERRLLNLAKASREADPKAFDMGSYVHFAVFDWQCRPVDYNGRFTPHLCWTPACAFGNYVARRDLQRSFSMESVFRDALGMEVSGPAPGGSVHGKLCNSVGERINHTRPEVLEHFGINVVEADELFSSAGCGAAKTGKQAARYIERFVARKRRAQARG
jgi:hypothetical protein